MWLQKLSESERDRITHNIERLQSIMDRVHKLGYFVIASQSGGYNELQKILDESVVRGRPVLWTKLNEANIGENNQKVALDNPLRFQNIMNQATDIIRREIAKENRAFKELGE